MIQAARPDIYRKYYTMLFMLVSTSVRQVLAGALSCARCGKLRFLRHAGARDSRKREEGEREEKGNNEERGPGRLKWKALVMAGVRAACRCMAKYTIL
jgi:hypothetical protein